MKIWVTFLAGLFCFCSSPAVAFRDRAIFVGLGYCSQNALNKVANKDSGAKGFLGSPFYALTFQYHYQFGFQWFLAPRFDTTFVSRSAAGDSAKVSFAHVVFPFGQNFSSYSDSVWDWYLGPGLIQYSLAGAGGTTQMNNGTSTAIFAEPGASATVQKVTLNLGTSFTSGPSRFALDLFFENAFSSSKRTQSLMIAYAYQFGGR